MNYGGMYSYAVDKGSPQYKVPFNQLHNIARVFTPEDKAVIGGLVAVMTGRKWTMSNHQQYFTSP